jgi:hypothetical protein
MPTPLLTFLIRFLWHRRCRLLLSWVAVLVAATVSLYVAYYGFHAPQRRDRNGGHTAIDFGGQYVLPRVMITGRGLHLYDRNDIRSALEQTYPREDEEPGRDNHDADQFMQWFLGNDSEPRRHLLASFLTPLAGNDPFAVSTYVLAGEERWSADALAEAAVPQRGGPLYPPTQALLFAPLALLPPNVAYRLVQCANLGLLFWCGWMLRCLSLPSPGDGLTRQVPRLSWPLATLGLILFPGVNGALVLSQNSVFSLALLTTGWLLMNRGRPFLGGIVWGLLAFKPVWAVAFGPALVLTGRWRATAGMAVTGLLLVALTLPLVGVHSWESWFILGREAADGYDRDENWVLLSRDLSNALRRYTVVYKDHWTTNHQDFLPRFVGNATWLGTVAVWVVVALLYRRRIRGAEGVGPAFVLFGAWMSCFHFMYYDTLLAALPLFLLFTDPDLLALRFWGPRPTGELLDYYRPVEDSEGEVEVWPLPPVPLLRGAYRLRALLNPVPLTVFALIIVVCQTAPGFDSSWNFPPFDTYFLWCLWVWCGFQLIRARRSSTDDTDHTDQKTMKRITGKGNAERVFLSSSG